MESVGIVRHVDGLGRIVIPKEMRGLFQIENGSGIEFVIDKEKIILKKHIPSCPFCSSEKGLIEFSGIKICEGCLKKLK